MGEFYRSKDKKQLTRESIIGLGEESFRKNYYPELQDKLLDLERINVRNKALITTIPDILLVGDIEGRIAPFTLTMKKPNPLTIEILRNKEIVNLLREAIHKVISKRSLVTINFTLTQPEKDYYFEARLHISEIDEILIMIRDMTERTLLEMKLRDMVERDGLTNLYNRRCFEKKLSEYDGNACRNLAILMIDIDGLKFVNDTLGHLAGDQVIITSANIIDSKFGKYGFVARVGGDEFGVIFDGLEIQNIEKELDELRKLLSKHNEEVETFKISLSSGYSFHKEGMVNVVSMFKESDNNMYQNKLLKSSSVRNNLVKTLMKALEAKDYITEGHAERMEEMGTKMGEALLLPQSKIDRIKLLTKFHDIGKVGIPDSILKKPSKLTEDEWKVMRTHCGIGERIAAESSELREIAHLILKHHEKWDGSGYPLGLKWENIPIECRILSIVDTFDAMTNDRPYRKALSIEAAVLEISECGGTQFDPNLVKIFNTIVKSSTIINK